MKKNIKVHMAACKSALGRSLTLWLVSSLIFNSIYRNPLNLEDESLGICLEGFVVARALCVPFVSLSRLQTRIKSLFQLLLVISYYLV